MFIVTMTALTTPLFAQDDVDESAFFADSSSVVDSAKVVNTTAATDAAEEKRSLGFSGEMNVYGTPSMSRAWFDDATVKGVGFSPYVVGNGLVDARLKGGAKVFADLEASISPERTDSIASPIPGIKIPMTSGGTSFAARELFLDANINHVVYLRAGKQVLQWGRCNLWNPTDLVNVEQKTFIAKMGHREGTYGLKMHVPYKTLFNFYSFVDMNRAVTAGDLAAAGKAEVLLDRTEVALSAWKREGRKPVFGLDLSSQIFEVQIGAEAVLRNGSDMQTLDLSGTVPLITAFDDTWIPRVALNLTKLLTLGGIPDRLIVSAEGYYNHLGYDTNIFNDPRVRNLKGMTELVGFTAVDGTPVLSVYEPNSYSRYYASIFCSISRFIIEPMTFSFNVLGNLDQNCYVLMTGINYAALNNFTTGVSIISAVGPEHTEYTTLYDALSVRLQMGVTF
jgi:hypothetical protein